MLEDITFIRLDLPLPFKPTTPILAPGKKHKLIFLRIVLLPSGNVLVKPDGSFCNDIS